MSFKCINVLIPVRPTQMDQREVTFWGLADEASTDEVIGKVLTTLENKTQCQDLSFSQVISESLLASANAQELLRKGVIGVDTTLPKLNRLTKGFHGGKLITIGGRPGTFKSAFVWQIAVQNGTKGIPVGVISLEMLADELGSRALAQIHRVHGQNLAAGRSDELDLVVRKESANASKGFIPTKVPDAT